MKRKDLLIALLALVIGIALGWYIANQQNTTVSQLPSSYLMGAIPTKVYDVSSSNVVGEVNTTGNYCKYLANSKLICPGTADTKMEYCLDLSNETCSGDEQCLLKTVQACVYEPSEEDPLMSTMINDINDINENLASQGANFALQKMSFYTTGEGHFFCLCPSADGTGREGVPIGQCLDASFQVKPECEMLQDKGTTDCMCPSEDGKRMEATPHSQCYTPEGGVDVFRDECTNLLRKGEHKVLKMDSRWVPNDQRRNAQGNDLTYMVDNRWSSLANGLSRVDDVEPAIDRGMTMFDTQLKSITAGDMNIVKKEYPAGEDLTFFGDNRFSYYGNINFAAPEKHEADIIHGSPFLGGGCGAVTWTFVFTEPNPTFGVEYGIIDTDTGSKLFPPWDGATDINNDGYLDTSHVEIAFSDRYWKFDVDLGRWVQKPCGLAIDEGPSDVETMMSHESGHAFGLHHFGAPPIALMNNKIFSYDPNMRQELYPPDIAGLTTLYKTWPNK